ncbi:BnaC03g75590D, partial [Brassica napus]
MLVCLILGHVEIRKKKTHCSKVFVEFRSEELLVLSPTASGTMCETIDEKKRKKDEKAREKALKKLKALDKAKKLEELKVTSLPLSL